MILLDTDTVTLLNQGHPQVAARALTATERIAITVVSRIEILRGRWDFLLKAADGGQLQRAQMLLHEAEQSLSKYTVVSINAAKAQWTASSTIFAERRFWATAARGRTDNC